MCRSAGWTRVPCELAPSWPIGRLLYVNPMARRRLDLCQNFGSVGLLLEPLLKFQRQAFCLKLIFSHRQRRDPRRQSCSRLLKFTHIQRHGEERKRDYRWPGQNVQKCYMRVMTLLAMWKEQRSMVLALWELCLKVFVNPLALPSFFTVATWTSFYSFQWTPSIYCKSRIFRMHFIFVYFVCGGVHKKNRMHTKNAKQVIESAAVSDCTKIPCVRKVRDLQHTKI